MASEQSNTRKKFFTEEDKQKLRDAAARDSGDRNAKMCGFPLLCLVELLFSFGWRKGELTGLSVGSVNLAEGFIRLEDSKNGEPREVPLTPKLTVLMQALVADRKADERLFPISDLRRAWKRLCKAAGLQSGRAGYIIHDMRRTAARTKRSAGISETVTSQIMGWKPGSRMFARYGIVDRDDMQKALVATEEWENSPDRHSLDINAPEIKPTIQ